MKGSTARLDHVIFIAHQPIILIDFANCRCRNCVASLHKSDLGVSPSFRGQSRLALLDCDSN
ncbi:hypothetical protein RBWH47_05243 [Rhodopirellula baltica WH47]|uniref:Uncharacterized protein n=1 Tax=Rhodopirellula baltica WH47 TaxID=991778 RepID=F2AVF0_RHOBT|nr:hypothetical protein RBWH47_05243 [Rhodopirellula baltica WH47]